MNKLLFGLLAVTLSCGAVAKGNAERGKQKADQVCAACHAVGGDWNKP